MKLLAWTVFLNLSIMTTWSCNPKLNINIILTLWQDDRYVKVNIFEINQLRWLASLSQHTCLQHSFVVPFVAYRGLRKLTATWRLSAELKRRRLAKMKGRLAAESLTGFQRLSHQISAADRSISSSCWSQVKSSQSLADLAVGVPASQVRVETLTCFRV